MPEIRTLRADEYDALHRFLERSFGHGRDWFRRNQPALARTDAEALDWSLVAVKDGEIVCHVGTFPLEIVAGPARLTCGGIGNVATAPEARGKGYMSQLLELAIERMDDRGWPLSVLWGDRKRYNRFGWERCGDVLYVDMDRRSLGEVEPAAVEEVDPTEPDVAARVAKLHSQLAYRVDRPDCDLKIQRTGIRLFLGPDGYLISRGDRSGNPTVIEVVSPNGKEAELILGVMNRTFGSSAQVILEPVSSERTRRLLAVASGWNAQSRAMFRMINWPAFLSQIAPLLQERAAGIPPFEQAIGCRWDENPAVAVATVRWDGKELKVTEGRHAKQYVELEAMQLVQLILGAPTAQYEAWGLFQRLLPVQLYIPQLDFV